MTYRELMQAIDKMTEEQKDCTVTIEDSAEEECYPAELSIAGSEHFSLDENHPVIYF